MQCREFGEISEAYLSGELLVETCIQVFAHLENCQKCRESFAAKSELRNKLRYVVKSSPEFQIEQHFANRLTANLQETALYANSSRNLFLRNRFRIPAIASVVLAFALGLGFLMLGGLERPALVNSQDAIVNGLTEISMKAAGDHEDCALEKLQTWEMMSKLDYPAKASYTEKVAKPLQASVYPEIEMLHAHDCGFDGKIFSHVILRTNGHIVSVIFDSDQTRSSDSMSNSPIVAGMQNGFQSASFQNDNQTVFVVSDLTELENLTIARTLSTSWSKT